MAEYLPAQLESVRKPEVEVLQPAKRESAPPAHPLVSLQARAGNQAIARMVQRSGPDEETAQAKHDSSLQRESEEMEEESVQGKHDPSLQRESEGEEEESVQGKHDPSLQRESEGEEEESVQGKHDPSLQRESEGEEEESVQGKHDPSLQRESEGEEEESVQGKHDPSLLRAGEEDEMVQGKHDPTPEVGLEGGPVGDQIQGQINSMRGQGSAVPEGVRRKMEGATGADLSSVRVHEGAESNALNHQLTAKAFTTGQDIFLRGDQSTGDSNLMAHELAHVVQQSSGRAASGGGGMAAGAANDPLEAEADSLAHAVLSGSAQRHSDESEA